MIVIVNVGAVEITRGSIVSKVEAQINYTVISNQLLTIETNGQLITEFKEAGNYVQSIDISQLNSGKLLFRLLSLNHTLYDYAEISFLSMSGDDSGAITANIFLPDRSSLQATVLHTAHDSGTMAFLTGSTGQSFSSLSWLGEASQNLAMLEELPRELYVSGWVAKHQYLEDGSAITFNKTMQVELVAPTGVYGGFRPSTSSLVSNVTLSPNFGILSSEMKASSINITAFGQPAPFSSLAETRTVRIR